MYVCMYIYIYTHTHTHIYAHVIWTRLFRIPLMGERTFFCYSSGVSERPKKGFQEISNTFHDWLTQWSRAILQKLIVSQLVTNFPKFYWPECSLPHSQYSATCPLIRSIQSTSSSPYFINIITIILAYIPSSYKWSISFTFPRPKPCVHFSSPIRTTRSAHLILFDHPNNIWWGVQIMKLLLWWTLPVLSL